MTLTLKPSEYLPKDHVRIDGTLYACSLDKQCKVQLHLQARGPSKRSTRKVDYIGWLKRLGLKGDLHIIEESWSDRAYILNGPDKLQGYGGDWIYSELNTITLLDTEQVFEYLDITYTHRNDMAIVRITDNSHQDIYLLVEGLCENRPTDVVNHSQTQKTTVEVISDNHLRELKMYGCDRAIDKSYLEYCRKQLHIYVGSTMTLGYDGTRYTSIENPAEIIRPRAAVFDLIKPIRITDLITDTKDDILKRLQKHDDVVHRNILYFIDQAQVDMGKLHTDIQPLSLDRGPFVYNVIVYVRAKKYIQPEVYFNGPEFTLKHAR